MEKIVDFCNEFAEKAKDFWGKTAPKVKEKTERIRARANEKRGEIQEEMDWVENFDWKTATASGLLLIVGLGSLGYALTGGDD